MSRPIVFISSTYYDLSHIRASLENFIHSLGYEAILSERGQVAFIPDTNLDISCYNEVRNANLFVLIIGGRYGSKSSKENQTTDENGFISSVTMQEFTEAVANGVYPYILISKSVYNEYHTYLKNKNIKGAGNIKYAYVDNPEIFNFIEHILNKNRIFPVHAFDEFSDIELWLKEQWAGLFNYLLKERKIINLDEKIDHQNKISSKIANYLEFILRKDNVANKKEVEKLIAEENDKLKSSKVLKKLAKDNFLVKYLSQKCHIESHDILILIKDSKNIEEFINKLDLEKQIENSVKEILSREQLIKEFHDAKEELGSLSLSLPD